MRYAVALGWMFAGCSFAPSRNVADAPISVGGDTMVDCATWSNKHFDPCTLPDPPGDVHLTVDGSPYTFDTSSGGRLADAGGTMLMIDTTTIDQLGTAATLWTVTTLDVEAGATLDVIGDDPLIVAAWNTITVEGTIDAGSRATGRTGAGADPSQCDSHVAGAGDDGDSGTGGGGGGGFGGAGGIGGTGDGNGTLRAGGSGGAAISAPAIVIGGCAGGASGQTGGERASGGSGGGGLLLAARISITVGGSVLAGGAGGGTDTSAVLSYGGGGGGSGGFVGFETGMLVLANATIAANGGGGGGGAVIAATGGAGQDGQASGTAAMGGSGGSGSAGEAGGEGSSVSSSDGATVTGGPPNGGAGGGGGGAGFVLQWATNVDTTGATISPPITAGP